jgi:3-oxoacyl-[acyl-carrier protein] reductase
MQDALLGMITDSQIQSTFEVNVFAGIIMMQYSVKLMKKSGSIINIASIIGLNGNAGQIVYSATKGAVIAITKSTAKELAADNIRVNAIAPGYIATDMLLSSNIAEEKLNVLKSQIGMQKFGSPDDVAKAALFLASDLSEYISGQVLGVDGVMSAPMPIRRGS